MRVLIRKRGLTQLSWWNQVEKVWKEKRQAVKVWHKAKKDGKMHHDVLKSLKVGVVEKTT